MTPDQTPALAGDPAGAARCPSCGAGVRSDAPWCTQCYFDLRPAPEPEPEPLPPVAAPVRAPAAAAYADPLNDPLTDPLTDPLVEPVAPVVAEGTRPTWPCTTCGMPNALTDSACSACGSGFLAAIREGEAPLLVLPVVGDITRFGRGQRFALAGALVLIVIVVTALFGFVLS